LELSTRRKPQRFFDVATEAREFLFERGLSLVGDVETKTASTPEFFASRE
jgi:hypothetical protein